MCLVCQKICWVDDVIITCLWFIIKRSIFLNKPDDVGSYTLLIVEKERYIFQIKFKCWCIRSTSIDKKEETMLCNRCAATHYERCYISSKWWSSNAPNNIIPIMCCWLSSKVNHDMSNGNGLLIITMNFSILDSVSQTVTVCEKKVITLFHVHFWCCCLLNFWTKQNMWWQQVQITAQHCGLIRLQ